MKKLIMAVSIFCSIISVSVIAETVPDKFKDIEVKFKKHFPFKIKSIEPSAMKEVVQIVTDKGIYYASADSEHFIQGSIFEFKKGFKNLTTARMIPLQKENLSSIKDHIVTYKAKVEKAQIYVFTDITCGFCGKLHEELDQYLDRGITVHYIGYPRSGLQGQGYTSNRNVWCANDKQAAFNLAFNRQQVPNAVCDSKLDKMYQVGAMFKVNGTPAIITPNMDVIPGYLSAEALAKRLGISS